MQKDLLCLNYKIGVLKDFNSYLDEADSLFEYDVIIADLDHVHNLFRKTQQPEDQIRILRKRKQEFSVFMDRQGLCVLFLRSRRAFHTYTDPIFQLTHHATNYDWVDLKGVESYIDTGSGFKLTIVSKNSAFLPYLRQGLIRWTAYIKKLHQPPGVVCNVLALAGGRYIAAAELKMESGGRVILLPDCDVEGKEEVLLECIQNAVEEESVTPPPSWLSDYKLAGEKQKDQEKNKIDKKIAELELQKQKIHSEKLEIVKYKKLLYETGKYQLEPVVRDAFRLLGFTVHEDYKPKPNSNIEIDAMIECQSFKAIVEIKGSTKGVTLDDFSQLTNKRTDDFKITNEYKQAVLVGNGYRLRPPSERPGEVVFDPNHVIPSAERQDVCLLSTIDLYNLVVRILSGEQLNLEKIKEKILLSKGVCNFD